MDAFKIEFAKRYPYLPPCYSGFLYGAISIYGDNNILYVYYGRNYLIPPEYALRIIDNDNTLVEYLKRLLGSGELSIHEHIPGSHCLTDGCRYIALADTIDKFWRALEKILIRSEMREEFMKLKSHYLQSIIDSQRTLISGMEEKLNTLRNVLPKVLQTDIDKQLDLLISHFQYSPDSHEITKIKEHFDLLK